MADGLQQHLSNWDPGPLSAADDLPPGPAAALAAVLEVPVPQGDLPPLWHWLHFLDWPARSALGEDGHPADGHFLPPVPDRRRMIAGGRLAVHAPLRSGVRTGRLSALTSAVVKQGRSGELVFVTVRHELSQGGVLCQVEEQDVVYRSGDGAPRPSRGGPEPPVSGAPWQLPLRADAALLFRVSALTANAHRIHYDEPYVRDVEGYPSLVVHGPLLALLMAEAVRGRPVSELRYRLTRPVFAGDPVLVTATPAGDGTAMAVLGSPDLVHAEASARFRS